MRPALVTRPGAVLRVLAVLLLGQRHRLLDVAVGLFQERLALHQTQPGGLAKLIDSLSRDLGHRHFSSLACERGGDLPPAVIHRNSGLVMDWFDRIGSRRDGVRRDAPARRDRRRRGACGLAMRRPSTPQGRWPAARPSSGITAARPRAGCRSRRPSRGSRTRRALAATASARRAAGRRLASAAGVGPARRGPPARARGRPRGRRCG